MARRSPASFLSLAATLSLAGTLAAGCAGTYSTYGYGVGTGVAAAPPPLYAPAPQDLVVLPGTNVYAAPSFSSGLYFVDGWWWRPWNGRWYRTSRYGSDWRYFAGTPGFYRSIPRDWRTDYYRRQWRGQPWNYHRVPRQEVVTNWDRWKRDQRWTWDRHGDHDRYRDRRDRDDRVRYDRDRDDRIRQDRYDRDRDDRDRDNRYRYDSDDFRREPVRYERYDRSGNDDGRGERTYRPTQEADRRWERPRSEDDSRRARQEVIRRPARTVVVPVSDSPPQGRGVRRGHDRDTDPRSDDADSGYVDWRDRERR